MGYSPCPKSKLILKNDIWKVGLKQQNLDLGIFQYLKKKFA